MWIVADATINGSETGTSFKQALYFKECGFNIHDTMIWNKGLFSTVGALSSRYASVFEYMFIFTKGKIKTFNPIRDRINIYAGAKIHGTTRQKDGSFRPMSGEGKIMNEYGQRFNIWNIPPLNSNAERTGHPAQFPESLVQDHIISWSNHSDVVFDPFLGSGTTAKMALLNDRHYIGFEMNEDYFQIADKRVKEAQEDWKDRSGEFWKV